MKIHGTAKGGAISKKDFGVAFSTSSNGGSQYVVSEGTWTNTDQYTTAKTGGSSGGASYNRTVAQTLPIEYEIAINDLGVRWYVAFSTISEIDTAWTNYSTIDERAIPYGLYFIGNADPTFASLVIDFDTPGTFSDAYTTSSRFNMKLTSSNFTITYSVDGTWTDTQTLYNESASPSGQYTLMVNQNTNVGSSSSTITPQ